MSKRKPYQERPQSRDAVWAQGYITPWQLLRIAAWKSAKGVALLSLNDEDTIVDQTRLLMAAIAPYRNHNVISDLTDWNRWEADVRRAVGDQTVKSGLLGLQGVGYPMATAILATVAPASFPIMDRWAIGGVFGQQMARRTSWHKAAAYRMFTETLATTTSRELIGISTVHERDQFVMNQTMGGHEIADLVPVTPEG
ncbi:MAG: hypothetical protein K8R99_05875 [Actinomycetia bacterium]|nr:hypothetical protein [Actinomycetes bacterium]